MMSRTKMAEAIGGSECTRIYTSLLSYREKERISRLSLKTYNCIVLTDFQHKKGGIPRDHSFLSHITLT